MIRPSPLLAAALSFGLTTSACTHELPLGGIAVGRGQPLGDNVIHVGVSGGRNPRLNSTLPVDPDVIVGGERLSETTGAGGFDWFGVAYGLNESIDIGFDFARGLHSVVRVAGSERWAASVSPAFYWYRGQQDNDVTSGNLTALLAFDPLPDGPYTLDMYTGGGLSLYHASLGEAPRRSRTALAPTVLAGLRVNAVCWIGCGDRSHAAWVVGELQGTWIDEYRGGANFVPTARVFIRIQGVFDPPRDRYPPPGPPPRPRPRQ